MMGMPNLSSQYLCLLSYVIIQLFGIEVEAEVQNSIKPLAEAIIVDSATHHIHSFIAHPCRLVPPKLL